jgi:hypothetical protein
MMNAVPTLGELQRTHTLLVAKLILFVYGEVLHNAMLIRAAGPSLAGLGVSGVVADPAFTVVDSTGATIASNDNWGTPVGTAPSATALSGAFALAGAFGFQPGSLDAAAIVSVGPGTYTVPANFPVRPGDTITIRERFF